VATLGQQPFHTTSAVQQFLVAIQFLAAKGVKTIRHLSYMYLPDLAPVDFFLFLKTKSELAGLSLTQGSFQKTWAGVVGKITEEEFAAAFLR
jgi:hypothetical protein